MQYVTASTKQKQILLP